MSKEIVEAVHLLEREKGISAERLMLALEDALLSAYKKQPGAAKYARVDMDRDTADFRVFELLVPEELEEKLLAEVEPAEPEVDPETGEMREPAEPELDPEMLAAVPAIRSTSATSRPTTSAASPPRPPSR